MGQRSLLYTAEDRYEDVVKILLKPNDVNLNTSDNHCQTPLSYAASKGIREW